jgi:hypothetical protein
MTHSVCFDRNAAGRLLLHQPCPSAALNAGQCRVELLLEFVQAAVFGVNGLGQLSRWRLSAGLRLWGQVLPK